MHTPVTPSSPPLCQIPPSRPSSFPRSKSAVSSSSTSPRWSMITHLVSMSRRWWARIWGPVQASFRNPWMVKLCLRYVLTGFILPGRLQLHNHDHQEPRTCLRRTPRQTWNNWNEKEVLKQKSICFKDRIIWGYIEPYKAKSNILLCSSRTV